MKKLIILLMILQTAWSSEYSEKEIRNIISITASRISNYVSSNYENYISNLKKEILISNQKIKIEFIQLTNDFNRLISIKDQKHELELQALENKWRAKSNKSFLGGIATGGAISLGIKILSDGFEFTPIQVKF